VPAIQGRAVITGGEHLPTCWEVVEAVTDFLEGRMSPVQRERFELHLAFCQACRIYLEQMRETIRLTGMLKVEEIPEETRLAIVEAFRDWNS
jgi:predicted anti-sigma-YlaC factor YlaD